MRYPQFVIPTLLFQHLHICIVSIFKQSYPIFHTAKPKNSNIVETIFNNDKTDRILSFFFHEKKTRLIHVSLQVCKRHTSLLFHNPSIRPHSKTSFLILYTSVKWKNKKLITSTRSKTLVSNTKRDKTYRR